MRKYILLLTSIFLLFIYSNYSVPVYAKDAEPTTSADSAILIDATTGTILFSKNKDVPYPPASTTKTMTALLTLEKCNLDELMKIGKLPPYADGSKIYIHEGEEMSVRNLLYGLLIVSANDCAEALAEHISGSIPEFAKLMNSRAKELGCTNTNFVNPSGLYDKNHNTSAYDLALIMRELVKHQDFINISSTNSYYIPPTNKEAKPRPLWNENKLLQKNSKFYYAGIEGAKTGYTVQSEHSYVVSATRNGQRLIVTLLHDKTTNYYADATALLNYGFKNYELIKMYNKGDSVEAFNNIPLIASEDYYFVREKNSNQTPSMSIESTDSLKKQFNKGDAVATADFSLNNATIGKLQLLSGNSYNPTKSLGLTSTNSKISFLSDKYYILSTSAFVVVMLMLLYIKSQKSKLKRKSNNQ